MTREEAIYILKNLAWLATSSVEDTEHAMQMAISALQDRSTGHWINIKDKLPEDGTWNLFTDGKNISVERYKCDAIDHFFPEGRWFTFAGVVAWMPLPEKYNAENN